MQFQATSVTTIAKAFNIQTLCVCIWGMAGEGGGVEGLFAIVQNSGGNVCFWFYQKTEGWRVHI